MASEAIIERSDDVLGGTTVFKDTRVPVRALLDYLKAGEGLDEFLLDFPTVTRERARQVLDLAEEALLSDAHENSMTPGEGEVTWKS